MCKGEVVKTFISDSVVSNNITHQWFQIIYILKTYFYELIFKYFISTLIHFPFFRHSLANSEMEILILILVCALRWTPFLYEFKNMYMCFKLCNQWFVIRHVRQKTYLKIDNLKILKKFLKWMFTSSRNLLWAFAH